MKYFIWIIITTKACSEFPSEELLNWYYSIWFISSVNEIHKWFCQKKSDLEYSESQEVIRGDSIADFNSNILNIKLCWHSPNGNKMRQKSDPSNRLRYIVYVTSIHFSYFRNWNNQRKQLSTKKSNFIIEILFLIFFFSLVERSAIEIGKQKTSIRQLIIHRTST